MCLSCMPLCLLVVLSLSLFWFVCFAFLLSFDCAVYWFVFVCMFSCCGMRA